MMSRVSCSVLRASCVAFCAALAAATVFADYTYYVRQNGGSDSNNGMSYDKAFATFQRARKAAVDISSTDEAKLAVKTIYIYPGEYHVAPKDADGNPYAEDQVIGSNKKNMHFIGVDDDGTGDVRTPADPKKVILDGDNVMRIFTAYSNTTGMHFRNLTLQNGTASFVKGYWPGLGGLIYFAGDNNVVSNCIFRNGLASSGGAIYGSGAMGNAVVDCKFYDCMTTNGSGGGAVYLNGTSATSQRYVRCDFVRCSASNGKEASGEGVKGGAIYCQSATANTNGFYLDTCNFVSNFCSGIGGAISGPVLLATNCTFVGNVANCDGSVNYPIVTGTYMTNRTNNFVDCTFVGNVAKALSGGDKIETGCRVGGLLVNYSSYVTDIRKCVFSNNVSYGFCGVFGHRGNGGVPIRMFDSVVTNNHIKGDVLDPIMETATKDLQTYGYSGVIRVSGGVVSNCVFSGNSSYGSAYVLSLGDGSKVYDSVFTDNVGKECPGKTGVTTVWGGVLAGSKYNLIRNCLICRNRRQFANGNGAAIYFDSTSNSSNRIENCTICDNLAKMDPEQYSVGPRLSGKGSVIVNSVCLGNKTEAGKEVNLCLQEGAVQSNCYYMAATAADFDDPHFRDREGGDYRPRAASPLRDAGMLLEWMSPTALDLAKKLRLNGELPDIGCYEYRSARN